MTTTTPGRVLLGLAALIGCSAPVWAFDFFCHDKKCGKGCVETQRVTLPQQRVEVVQEQPRVVVREVAPAREVVTRTVKHRAAEVPIVPLSTVYLPVTVPVAPMIAAPTREVREICEPRERELEYNPLEAVHRAELAAYKSEKARRELELQRDIHHRALQRLDAIGSGADRSRAPSDAGCSAQVEQRLNQLAGEIQKLNDRVTSVEKLLIYHDNLITQNQNAGGRGVAPPPGPAIPPAGAGQRSGPGIMIPAVPPPPGLSNPGSGNPPPGPGIPPQ